MTKIKHIVNIPKENREWGYNPCPDGTEVEVIDFSEITYGYVNNFGNRPGVYTNPSWVRVRASDGREWTEFASRLTPVPQGESTWLRELPETPFWPGDVVKVSGEQDVQVIQLVHYENIGKVRNDSSPMPLYDLADHIYAGSYRVGIENWRIALVERGEVWRYYHGEPLRNTDIESVAKLQQWMGLTDEVINPEFNLYSWTIGEAVQALKDGIGHSISVGGGLFGSGPKTRVERFRDAKLGERVRQLTLAGFTDEAVADLMKRPEVAREWEIRKTLLRT